MGGLFGGTSANLTMLRENLNRTFATQCLLTRYSHEALTKIGNIVSWPGTNRSTFEFMRP